MAWVLASASQPASASTQNLKNLTQDYILRETQVRCWVEETLEVKFDNLDLSHVLHSGIYLCKLMIKIAPNSIPNIHQTEAEYLYRENIEFFLQAMEEYGVVTRFTTPDLLKKQNMTLVIESLLKLGELAMQNGFKPLLTPTLELIPPSLDSLSPSHKRTIQNIIRFSKKVATPIVPPRIRHLVPQPEQKGITQFQALVRGHLERKKLRVIKRHNAYRSNVAKEILETETSYVNSLKECIDYYMTPLQNASNEKVACIKDCAPIVPKPVLRSLFSDLRIIYNFHDQSILSKILPRVENWNIYQCLGDIFLEIVSMMKIYTQYISNYVTSMGVYRELENNPSFREWARAVEEEIGGKVLPFFLIMPVQRIPRYVMLLGDLFKHTWEDHADYNNLQEATKKMQELTAFLDAKEQQAENITRLAKIASECRGILNINLAEAHRKFIREDTFNGKKVYLFNDILLITTIQSDHQLNKGGWKKRFSKDSSACNKATYHWLRNLMVCVNESDSGFLVLASGSRETVMNVITDKSIRDDWIKAFRKQKRRKNTGVTRGIRFSSANMNPVRISAQLTRDDSYMELKQNKDVLQNHMFKLKIHMKTTKKKKEKKALGALEQNLMAEAELLDKQIKEKQKTRKIQKTRKLQRRSMSVEELLKKKC